jgi:hypothetical protein
MAEMKLAKKTEKEQRRAANAQKRLNKMTELTMVQKEEAAPANKKPKAKGKKAK